MRNVIIDAKFGAWSHGYPQGIGWGLLEEMNEKWGKNFRIYNDQSLSRDTRRYTSDRRDLSDRWLLEDQSRHEAEEADAEGRNDEQGAIEHEALEQWGEIKDVKEDAGEEKGDKKTEKSRKHFLELDFLILLPRKYRVP